MKLNRRDFLKVSSAMAIGGMYLSPDLVRAASSSAQQLAILYDASKCVGCRACQTSCKRWNKLPAESSRAETLPVEIESNQKLYDTPVGFSANTWTLIKLAKTRC